MTACRSRGDPRGPHKDALRPARKCGTIQLALLLFSLFFIDRIRGQNIVEDTAADFTANPVALTDTEVSEWLGRTPAIKPAAGDPESQHIVSKLEAHVREFLDGAPWMPFQHTLGISGYEVCFDHPDEMFHALSIALPCLSPALAEKVKAHLGAQLARLPPYAVDGFDRRAGRARESYDIPETLRLPGRGIARSAFGVYAFWAYVRFSGDQAAAKSHCDALRVRMQPLLEADYPFDVRREGYANDEPERLNGDLAGLIGLGRLARLVGDAPLERLAARKAGQLLALRVNLERVNPKILAKSNASSKHLHYFKLARYCALVPEVGQALHRWSDGCGPARLKAFREERNGWYLAFGDRLIGGENYTNPLHFPRSLFAGAAWVEEMDGPSLGRFIDVPWCKGDFAFIEKCVAALWAAAGRPWIQLP